MAPQSDLEKHFEGMPNAKFAGSAYMPHLS
jgi:hypothetical protein